MRFATTIQCNNQEVDVEVTADGELIFHNYEIESDIAGEALGLDKTDCLEFYEHFLAMPIETMVKRFPLTGEAWLAIFITLLREKQFLYTDMMKMIDDLSESIGHLTPLPIEMLDDLERSITEGLRKTREETVADWERSSNETRTMGENEGYLEDVYEEGISSLIGATEAWVKAVQYLYLYCPGLNCEILGDPGDAFMRKTIIDHIVEASWLICFFKVKRVSAPGLPNQAMFNDAMAMQHERLDEMIRTMVAVAGAIEE
jgi:hypothetical protein